MPTRVTLDTNVIIYYLKGEDTVTSLLHSLFSLQTSVFIAAVTELELLSSPALTETDLSEIESFLSVLSIISLDSQVARIAAKLRRESRLKTPDSIVAATALFTQSTLLTRNARDFKKLSDLTVQSV